MEFLVVGFRKVLCIKLDSVLIKRDGVTIVQGIKVLFLNVWVKIGYDLRVVNCRKDVIGFFFQYRIFYLNFLYNSIV